MKDVQRTTGWVAPHPTVAHMAATVLVVDDSECIRQLLCLTLKHAGYEVLEAEDAAAAVRLLRERHVDLMLADIDMPSMGGLDLVRALRGDRSVSSLRVVFLTSHTEYQEEARELGAVGYLTKPVSTRSLSATVAQQLLVPA